MKTPAKHRSLAPGDIGLAVLTVSDSRTPEDDISGWRIQELATEVGHRVVERRLVGDDIAAIRPAVAELAALPGVDIVVVSGGTGFSPRDVTLEAVAPLLDPVIEGFGELFRMLSFEQVRAAAMLSRATAGLIEDRVVFVLPGSPKAVELAMEKLILPEAGHLLGQMRA
ncbi:MAG: MogA/MoaB family molybdenum cofactor biosynthesis protein [Acidobacteria bacterium]|nr:MAG: MogA/MoaB family molybdenum cofactor biosynthesis protein [Acidobacteriota bacterium]